MNDKIVNLKDLFFQQLRVILKGEQQQLSTLKTMDKNATSMELKEVLQRHINETEQQLHRMENIFLKLDQDPEGEESSVMQCLIGEFQQLINRSVDEEVRDAAIITAIQHINHYEIACYGTALAYARGMDFDEVSRLLHQSLVEEKKADIDLTQLAFGGINEKAMMPVFR